ncbi:MAG: tocopherol cyclase family protein [bacterium]|nr:tocopherol cyclase family protein [bacterium]
MDKINRKILETIKPEIFHSSRAFGNYFEGWYYKFVSDTDGSTLAVIPGVSINENDPHSFIQIFSDFDNTVRYLKFPLSKFSFSGREFRTTVNKSSFSLDRIYLNETGEDGKKIFCDIHVFNHDKISKSLLQPGAMGIFSYIQNMQCNHHILSMRSTARGVAKLNGERIDFSSSRAYIEKDFGESFPSKYIWMRSNSFDDDSTSFMCSIAEIPFGRFSFTGFISVFKSNDIEYRFATYNFSSFNILSCYAESCEINLENVLAKLSIKASSRHPLSLKSPSNGIMSSHINESLSGELKIDFQDKFRKIRKTAVSNKAAVEIEFYKEW